MAELYLHQRTPRRRLLKLTKLQMSLHVTIKETDLIKVLIISCSFITTILKKKTVWSLYDHCPLPLCCIRHKVDLGHSWLTTSNHAVLVFCAISNQMGTPTLPNIWHVIVSPCRFAFLWLIQTVTAKAQRELSV